MRAAWGHIYTQKDAEDHVKRTKQMLAKVGDADSSVDNAAKVEQPGALPMAYDGAHPKESAMTPGEVRADIEKHVRRIAPPATASGVPPTRQEAHRNAGPSVSSLAWAA